MRHDIDYDLNQAVTLAEIEKMKGVKSTYFVLLSSDFYNPASASSYKILHKISNLGHDIGLHFDETAYNYDSHDIDYYIFKEAKILSEITDLTITSFSLHRPNKYTIETQLAIPGLTNSYGEEFFHSFKYLSDSRRRWREPVEKIIMSNQYDRLHILTHAFWYHDNSKDISDTVNSFINKAKEDRLGFLSENITNIEQILEG